MAIAKGSSNDETREFVTGDVGGGASEVHRLTVEVELEQRILLAVEHVDQFVSLVDGDRCHGIEARDIGSIGTKGRLERECIGAGLRSEHPHHSNNTHHGGSQPPHPPPT
ncbi:MAG TPA: hypothetical protein VF125_00050 [Solirubrobacterales bacterium]